MEERPRRGGWRGGSATRLEALTDAVFAFAITLLVVSLEVPGTFDELLTILRGFVAFACSFALLVFVWWYHYRLFSRYRLEDGYTVVLNAALLFIVLFYVYPLKFVFTAWLGPERGSMFSSAEQLQLMMTVYGLGFVAVFVMFALLYRHAAASPGRIELDELEVLQAKKRVGECLTMVAVGLVSVALAQLLPPRWAPPFAGFAYFLIGPAQLVNGRHHEKKRRRLESATAAAGATSAGPTRTEDADA